MGVRFPDPSSCGYHQSNFPVLRATLLSRYSTYVLLLALLLLGWSRYSRSATPASSGSMTTRERIASTPWWPTSTAADKHAFVGAQACSKCHAEIYRSQANSQMAHTLGFAAASSVLQQNLAQQFHSGPYTYSVSRQKEQFRVTVRHGAESQSATLQWAFGSGQVGQSYLWLDGDGSFREARFNYFSSVKGFAATPGRLHGPPATIGRALGRQVEGFEAKTCFGCHTTGLTSGSALNETGFTPGITCEACHGPGAQHIGVMQTGASTGAGAGLNILNPARLTPAQSVDLCGACHSTPWDVRIMGASGLQTVRFPAYRLEKSRCWGASGDARLTCQSCHNPHAPLEHDLAAYDAVCLQCHNRFPAKVTAQATAKTNAETLSTEHPGPVCPVATSRCISCHMQKYEIPEMHSQFTDHMIRIVRPNTAIPD